MRALADSVAWVFGPMAGQFNTITFAPERPGNVSWTEKKKNSDTYDTVTTGVLRYTRDNKASAVADFVNLYSGLADTVVRDTRNHQNQLTLNADSSEMKEEFTWAGRKKFVVFQDEDSEI
jgi:hypothetical protein